MKWRTGWQEIHPNLDPRTNLMQFLNSFICSCTNFRDKWIRRWDLDLSIFWNPEIFEQSNSVDQSNIVKMEHWLRAQIEHLIVYKFLCRFHLIDSPNSKVFNENPLLNTHSYNVEGMLVCKQVCCKCFEGLKGESPNCW